MTEGLVQHFCLFGGTCILQPHDDHCFDLLLDLLNLAAYYFLEYLDHCLWVWFGHNEKLSWGSLGNKLDVFLGGQRGQHCRLGHKMMLLIVVVARKSNYYPIGQVGWLERFPIKSGIFLEHKLHSSRGVLDFQ